MRFAPSGLFDTSFYFEHQLYNSMIEAQLFLNEWGVWFCFQAEPNEPSDKYYENFQLVFTLAAPPDLAYAWQHFGLNTLENFLVKPSGQQNTYSEP